MVQNLTLLVPFISGEIGHLSKVDINERVKWTANKNKNDISLQVESRLEFGIDHHGIVQDLVSGFTSPAPHPIYIAYDMNVATDDFGNPLEIVYADVLQGLLAQISPADLDTWKKRMVIAAVKEIPGGVPIYLYWSV